MGALVGLLTVPQRSLLQHSFLLWPLALVPSLVFVIAARAAFTFAGVDLAAITPPNRPASVEFLLSSVVFAPFVETLLMTAGVRLLSVAISQHLLVAAISGILWGIFHGMFGLLWFFGSAWSFFVFSCAYLAWRPRSFSSGFVAAALPHALVNLTAVGLLALAEHR